MTRKAKVFLCTGWIYTIDCGVSRTHWIKIGRTYPYGWAQYSEDDRGRLAWIYEPLAASSKGIHAEIERMMRYPRPAFKEIFDEVDIINEETGAVYAELHDVDLFGILEGIKDVIQSQFCGVRHQT